MDRYIVDDSTNKELSPVFGVALPWAPRYNHHKPPGPDGGRPRMDFNKVCYVLVMFSALCFVLTLPVLADYENSFPLDIGPGIKANQANIQMASTRIVFTGGNENQDSNETYIRVIDSTGQIVAFIPSDWFVNKFQNTSSWKYVMVWYQDNSALNTITSIKIPVIKPERTTAQEKLSSDLLQLSDSRFIPAGMTMSDLEQQMNQNHQLTWIDKNGSVSNNETGSPAVYVYIKTYENANASSLTPFIVEITDADSINNLLAAWVGTDNLIPLASLDAVRWIQTVIPPITQTGTL